MITFDKLKMVVGLGAIISYDGTRFEATVKNGKTSARKYYQEYPFLLKIKLDYKRYEAVIEFSGKILGKDYPELISSKTIRQCFENINTIGVCEVDVDAMMDAEVVKCDVTTDRTVTDIPELTGYIRSHIRNYQQYPCRKYSNGNLVIEKNVVSSRTKKRLTIYDKEQEMKRAENSKFVKDNGLQGSYEGVCRLELNLNSKEQIRFSLLTHDTKLSSVLSSKAEPIRAFLKDIVGEVPKPQPLSNRKTYFTMLVLKDCDYDLEKVEAKMRELYPSRGTSISKLMEPYRAMAEQIGKQKAAAKRKKRAKSEDELI